MTHVRHLPALVAYLDLRRMDGEGWSGVVVVAGVPPTALTVRSRQRVSSMPEPITPKDDEALRLR